MKLRYLLCTIFAMNFMQAPVFLKDGIEVDSREILEGDDHITKYVEMQDAPLVDPVSGYISFTTRS